MNDKNMISRVVEKINDSKDLTPEFQDVIEENFWDLVETPEMTRVKIFTSYYSSPVLKEGLMTGNLVPVSISIHPPKGWKEKGNLWYPPLCPDEKMFWDVKTTGDQKKYVEELLRKFGDLDPHRVVGDLLKMSGGKPVVLLCYEKPVPLVNGIFCHRQIVSEWLGSNGIVVPELTRRHVQDLIQDDEESLF